MSAIKFRETLTSWAALADGDLFACADVSEAGEFVAVPKTLLTTTFALAGHTHSGVYAAVDHDHDDDYDALGAAAAVAGDLSTHEGDTEAHGISEFGATLVSAADAAAAWTVLDISSETISAALLVIDGGLL